MRSTHARAAVLFAIIAAGCATQETPEADAQNQAVRDFIAVRNLPETHRIRSGDRDGWTEININYVIYETNRDTYLFEFVRPCYELRDNTRIVPDMRNEPSLIRARFDTLRGCRIDRIYELTEAEAAELREIGETPGERN